MNFKYVASGDDSGIVQIHRLFNDDDDNDDKIRIEVEDKKPITHILFHGDGKSIFVSTTGPDVVQYSIENGVKMKDFKGKVDEQITALG